MKYSEQINKRLREMNIFEKEYREIKVEIREYALKGFKDALEGYKDVLKSFVDKVLDEREITEGINMYESILKLRYQEGIFKGVDIELLLELLFEEGVLCDKYKYDNDSGLCDFYINNKEQFQFIASQIEVYERV